VPPLDALLSVHALDRRTSQSTSPAKPSPRGPPTSEDSATLMVVEEGWSYRAALGNRDLLVAAGAAELLGVH
jgi:hypothetical protein